MTGLDGLDYISSSFQLAGRAAQSRLDLPVTGSDPDIAQGAVQNKLALRPRSCLRQYSGQGP